MGAKKIIDAGFFIIRKNTMCLNRRWLLRCLLVNLVLCIVTALAGDAASSTWNVSHPRCEYLVNPVGIDTLKPRFSWVLESTRRGARQAAYQVLVATTEAGLATNNADLWDSGKVESDQSSQIFYSGSALRFGTRCFWKVRTWDDAGRLATSEVARWSMGPLDRTDWDDAKWIGAAPEKEIPYSQWRARYGYRSLSAPTTGVVKWVGVDLGESRAIDQIRFFGAGVPGVPNLFFPLRFRIDVSDDATFANYKTVADATNEDFIPDPKTQQEWSGKIEPTKARYVRLCATQLRNHPNPKIIEYALAIAQMQVLQHGEIVSANAKSIALDVLPTTGWSGDFVTDGLLESRPPRSNWVIPPSPLLRKTFEVAAAVTHAEVSVTALGEYELRINGQRVGDHQLAPEWTDYRQRVQYQTYDVTKMVQQGGNAIAATLGDGWYLGRLAGTRWNSDFPKRGLYGLNRRLLLRLDIHRSDGTTQTITSDGSWKIDPDGPIRSADHFLGETYDGRKEQPGWDQPIFDDAKWAAVTVDESVQIALTAQMNEPIRIIKTIKPVAITEPKPGVYVIKFPETIAGWVRIRAAGPAGTDLKLRHAEWLNRDGTLFTQVYGGAKSIDEFILDGKEARWLEPHFTYHGFQYVEVTGLTQPPTLDLLEARVVHSDAPAAGKFACSDPLLNQIWAMAVRTQGANMYSVPTDCPNRDERYGYGGDALSFSDCAMFNIDMAAFFSKWTRDWRETLGPDNICPPFAPYPWFEHEPRQMEVMGWSDALVQIPWKAYQRYNDVAVLASHYDTMRRWMTRVSSQAKDSIWAVGTCGDWLSQAMIKDVPGYPSEGGWTGLPNDVFGTIFYYSSTRAIAGAAEAIGKTADAAAYHEQADRIAESFNRHFVSADGSIKGDNQSTYVLALDSDILPETIRSAAATQLIRQIEKYDGRLSTGIIATPKLLNVLTRFGYADRAYQLMQSHRFPSLGFMIDQGATTVWERWDNYLPEKGNHKDGMQSYQHVALGGHAQWLYSSVLGIQADLAKPGFSHAIIHPEPGGGVTWAKGEHETIHGTVKSAWRIENGRFMFDLSVPPGMTATVILPAQDFAKIQESDQPLAQAAGIKVRDTSSIEVQSGQYSFSCPVSGETTRESK